MAYDPLTELADDLSVISKLGDEPNSDDGLSADELKAKFDQAGLIIQAYINSLLKDKVDDIGGDLDTLTTRVDNIIEQEIPVGSIDTDKIADGAVTSEKLGLEQDYAIPVSHGGTGATTLTSGQALIGNGTGAVTTRGIKDNASATAPSSSSQYLVTERTLKYAIGISGGAASYDEWHNLGTNAINASANDTPANWYSKGSGYSWYNANNIGLPYNIGILINYAPAASGVIQFYYARNYDALYHRHCNTDGTAWDGGWVKLANTTDNVASATKLATARTIRTNLASTSTASFDGSGNVTPGVTGTLPVANGGTGETTKGAALDALILAREDENTDTAPTDNAYYVSGGASGSKTFYIRKHLYLYNYIKGKLDSVYAALSHNHAATDITSGSLPVTRGGTGGTAFSTGYAIIGNNQSPFTTRAITNYTTATEAAGSTNLATMNVIAHTIFGTSQIPSLAASKITSGTFATARIGDSAITTAKINGGAVTTAKIADSAVTNAKLASGIGGAKITSPALTTWGARRVYIGSSTPSSPATGDLWLVP